MTLIFYKAIAALFIFLVSIATIIYPLKKKNLLKPMESMALGEALASGIFLGAALFHMLPDAIESFGELYGTATYPFPEMICALGFLFLLFLERLSLAFSTIRSKNAIPYILALTLIIHSLIEGMALGIGPTFSEALLLFIAIIAHKGSESFALCMTLLRHHCPLPRIIFLVIFFALMTPLGILFGTTLDAYTFLPSGELTAAIFNAFAAGTFLYISTLHHAHFHQHKNEAQGLLEFISLVLGVLLMGVLAVWS